jgi:hypothetical protein
MTEPENEVAERLASEVEERVARKLSGSGDLDGMEWYHVNPEYWTMLARAAIAAMPSPEAAKLALEELKIAQNQIISATIASCTCHTKTAEASMHAADCRYLKLSHALDSLDSVEAALGAMLHPSPTGDLK